MPPHLPKVVSHRHEGIFDRIPNHATCTSLLVTLRVIRIRIMAGVRRLTCRRSSPEHSVSAKLIIWGGANSPANSAALAPLRRASGRTTAPTCGCCTCGLRTPAVCCGGFGRCGACGPTRGAELALDEGESLLAVFRAVALVDAGVIAIAAVRIRRVAVALDLAADRALEASRTGIKLGKMSIIDPSPTERAYSRRRRGRCRPRS